MSSSDHDARAVIREFVKRFGAIPKPDEGALPDRTFRWKEDLFEYQIKFIEDPSHFKTALCSRRSGKTYACCYYLIEMATRHPDCLCAYIGLSRRSAKRLMWQEMKRANRKYMLGIRFNNSELVATFKNGSQVILTGANDEADIDKLRGSTYRLVILDEAASFGPHMDALVEEVLEPALIDHNGTLAMIGTPSAACSGMFYRATTEADFGYTNHHWTILENPHIPHAQDWLDRRMKQKGWSTDNPIYQREWRGRWMRSNDSIVYKYTEENIVNTLPWDDHDWQFILGVDLGYEDATAFVIGAFCEDLPDFYIIEDYKSSKMLPSDIAEKIKQYNREYDFRVMVADTGGLGKSIVEEFRFRHGLAMRAAEKRNKLSYIELMNSDLASARIKVLEGCGVLDEWRLLQWDEDRPKEDGRFENHLADAALYAWRESRHYASVAREEEPDIGSIVYYEREADRMEQRAVDKLAQKDGNTWWENIRH
jgi:hypothetical protein